MANSNSVLALLLSLPLLLGSIGLGCGETDSKETTRLHLGATDIARTGAVEYALTHNGEEIASGVFTEEVAPLACNAETGGGTKLDRGEGHYLLRATSEHGWSWEEEWDPAKIRQMESTCTGFSFDLTTVQTGFFAMGVDGDLFLPAEVRMNGEHIGWISKSISLNDWPVYNEDYTWSWARELLPVLLELQDKGMAIVIHGDPSESMIEVEFADGEVSVFEYSFIPTSARIVHEYLFGY